MEITKNTMVDALIQCGWVEEMEKEKYYNKVFYRKDNYSIRLSMYSGVHLRNTQGGIIYYTFKDYYYKELTKELRLVKIKKIKDGMEHS